MARPREFDIDRARGGAMDIFWRRGFKATNLPDLLAAMGLTRGSFYKAFRDKETAYLQALDHYDRSVVAATVRALDSCQEDSAWACLSRLFGPGAADRRGCLICNAMVELAPDHPAVADRANAMAARLRQAILGVLRRHDTGGTGRSPEDTADMILHLYFGHQAMGKAGDRPVDWTARLKSLLDGG